MRERFTMPEVVVDRAWLSRILEANDEHFIVT